MSTYMEIRKMGVQESWSNVSMATPQKIELMDVLIYRLIRLLCGKE